MIGLARSDDQLLVSANSDGCSTVMEVNNSTETGRWYSERAHAERRHSMSSALSPLHFVEARGGAALVVVRHEIAPAQVLRVALGVAGHGV